MLKYNFNKAFQLETTALLHENIAVLYMNNFVEKEI